MRNLRGLADRYADERRWAQTLLVHTDDLFLLWQLYRGGWIDQVTLQQALIPIRMDIHALLLRGTTSPHANLAAFSRDLLAQWDALWTFSRVAGIEPTNNTAERALRHAVLWRKGHLARAVPPAVALSRACSVSTPHASSRNDPCLPS